MQPYKPTRRSSSIIPILIRGGLVVVATILLFLIIGSIVDAIRVPSLRGPALLQSLSSRKNLLKHIADLEQEKESSRVLREEAAMLRKENESLKMQLGRRVHTSEGVLARVLTLPNRSFYDTIIVDVGSADGVTVEQFVFAFDTILIGTITDVQDHRSTVQLFSAPGRQTSGTAEGSDLSITLIGRGSGEYEVRMPRDLSFTLGELISYQSMETAVLAKIEHIATDPRDPFQRLLAKAPVNLAALKFVMVR